MPFIVAYLRRRIQHVQNTTDYTTFFTVAAPAASLPVQIFHPFLFVIDHQVGHQGTIQATTVLLLHNCYLPAVLALQFVLVQSTGSHRGKFLWACIIDVLLLFFFGAQRRIKLGRHGFVDEGTSKSFGSSACLFDNSSGSWSLIAM